MNRNETGFFANLIMTSTVPVQYAICLPSPRCEPGDCDQRQRHCEHAIGHEHAEILEGQTLGAEKTGKCTVKSYNTQHTNTWC